MRGAARLACAMLTATVWLGCSPGPTSGALGSLGEGGGAGDGASSHEGGGGEAPNIPAGGTDGSGGDGPVDPPANALPPTTQVGLARPAFRALTDAGLAYYPDMPVATVPRTEGAAYYLPVGRSTYRLVGPSPEEATDPVEVLAPTGDPAAPDHGYAGVGSVVECGDRLVMFYHAENHWLPAQSGVAWSCGAPAYHASMNRATSTDQGLTWTRDEPSTIVASAAPSAYGQYGPSYCAYGAGGGTVVRVGDYFYMYYTDWNLPEPGIQLARAPVSSCGEVGSWQKLHDGEFQSAAVTDGFDQPSGPSSAVVAGPAGTWDAFCSVSHNSYLDAYLMLAATESGIGLRTSADAIHWSDRVDVLEHWPVAGGPVYQFYPSAVDAFTYSRQHTGRQLLLLYAATADDRGVPGSHRGYAADLLLTKADEESPGVGTATLTRSWNGVDHRSSTSPLDAALGYSSEGPLGLLAANSIPGTHPLYECVVAGFDHMLSIDPWCEGHSTLRQAGFAYAGAAPGAVQLSRCITGAGEHFESVDPACEAHAIEGALGSLGPW